MPTLWPCVSNLALMCTYHTDHSMMCQVINPSVRMSWITNNWEDDWAKKATSMMKTLVSEISDF